MRDTLKPAPSREAEIAARRRQWTELELWLLLEDRIAVLEAALQQAREALDRYGQHNGGCKKLSRLAPSDGSWPCTCGLDAALKAVR